MVTKGVASVPSPVKNLSELASAGRGGQIDHERFVKVVADEFAKQHGLGREVQVRLRFGRTRAGNAEELMSFGGSRSGSTSLKQTGTATCGR